MNLADVLNTELHRCELDLPAAARHQLLDYAGEIQHWNRAVNLTALNGEMLVRRLIAEPIWIGFQLQMTGTLVDVGSGNGSPGIPLALTREFKEVFLMEPRLKRAVFLRHLIAKLALRNVEVVRERIEDVPGGRICADWITLQAIEPKEDILHALKEVATKTTHVVWITSKETPPVSSAEMIRVPQSTSKVWLFQLDQT